MKTSLVSLMICSAAVASLILASHDRALASEHESIDRTFELSPGARVDVSSISGPVIVEISGSSTAEVHIERSARSRAELDLAPMIVEGSASSLVIRTQQQRNSRHGIQLDERVTLRLPASISFKASSVSGDVTVGRIEGAVNLSSISGDVHVGGASGALDLSSISGDVDVERASGYAKISSVSGSVLVAIEELGERGINASSISGDVEIRLLGRVDADITVDSISGGVTSATGDMTVTKVSESSFRGRLGNGGAPISISSISGNVRFTGQ